MAVFALEDVKVLQETDKALLIDLEGEPVWVPKSCIDFEESDVERVGDEGILMVQEWWAEKEGLC